MYTYIWLILTCHRHLSVLSIGEAVIYNNNLTKWEKRHFQSDRVTNKNLKREVLYLWCCIVEPTAVFQ